MKILIGTTDVAGWVNTYKEAFEKLGHQVTTAVVEKNNFYNHKYDIILNEKLRSFQYKKEVGEKEHFKKIVRKLKNKLAYHLYKYFIFSLIKEHDLFIKIWHPLLEESFDNKILKKNKKKYIQLFVGSDVRYLKAFIQDFKISQWSFPSSFGNLPIERNLKIIRYAEKYADNIYSLPDQSSLQFRPYYHLQVPLIVSKFVFKNNRRKIPKVIHAPSEPFKKGTDIIESTLARLSAEGILFEFVSVRNLQHDDLLKLLTDCDILVDELVYHGPGGLSFEAMLSGCAVATKYIESSPDCFKPPVWAIDANNIYEKLKILLTDLELRCKLIDQGLLYATRNNDVKQIAQQLLIDLEVKREYDYYPDFLRKKYIPEDKKDTEEINKWTKLVENTTWYKKYILKGEREGLKF